MILRNSFLFLLLLLSLLNPLFSQTVDGELRRWHKISLTFDGPNTSETGNPNPFTDYEMEVTFTHVGSATSYTIPGYYAACGDAAETSCTSGNKWRAHFSPDRIGTWSWQASFRKGNDVAINGGGSIAGFFHGQTGTFTVQESNKSGRDHRARNKGRLAYVGQHYLRFMGTDPANPNGDWFIKAGADAPENMLSYNDFDEVPTPQKTWAPHQQDYSAADALDYTWQGGKGSEMLGAIRYLGDIKNVNAFSFLTFSLDGDDKTVSPHLTSQGDGKGWNKVHHDRFDVSRTAQWEKIFAYADKKGMFLHFKTQETENDQKMDGGNVGRERKIYYRELIARFGHHLALNWNLGEENTQTMNQRRDMAQYFADHDPYQHLVVIHTYPNQQDQVYNGLIGNRSELTGASVQTGINNVHKDVARWVKNSANEGRPWVVANDEQGGANKGVDVDPNERKKVREEVIWGTLMAGGAGFEYYYGYQTGCSDLTCQDHRTRDDKYTDAAYALEFFYDYFMPHLPEVVNEDGEISANNAYLLRTKDKKAYVIYLPNGGNSSISGLPGGTHNLRWFNPRNGQMGNVQSLSNNQIAAPDNQDWVAFIETDGSTPPPPPNPQYVLEEIDGILSIEAEHFSTQSKTDKRKWYSTSSSNTPGITPDPDPNHASGASEGGYLEILPDTRVTHSDPLVNGESFSNTPGVLAVINYEVYINNPGRYYVWVRAYSTGTEDNGVHVGLDGNWPASGARMQWCSGKNKWTWESKQRTNQNHCGEPERIYLDINTPGLHTISFSMREDGFEMDKIVLTDAYSKPQGNGPDEVIYGNTPSPPPSTSQTPYGGAPWPVPGNIEAEDYDEGGAEIAYADLDDANNGGKYRTDEVDIESTTDVGGGFNVGWIRAGEWLEYTVDVLDAGDYTLDLRVAARSQAGACHLEIDNNDVTGPISVPVTGGWQTWTTVSTGPIPLSAGEQVIRLVMDKKGFNVNHLEFTKNNTLPAPDSQVVHFYPVHDAYLDGRNAQKRRYNSSLLRVEDGRRKTYLKFDLSGIPNRILDAKLTMTCTSDPGHGEFVVSQASHSNWTETNLSTGNAPHATQALASLTGNFSVSNEYTWELGELPSGGPISFVVSHAYGNDAAFASKEVANPDFRPVLTLTIEGNNSNEELTLVSWSGIEAEEVIDQTMVNWRVAEENNIETYILERSLDGLLFESHHEQFSMGNSKTGHAYSALIPTAADLDMTFRVRAKGKDGYVSYSPPFLLQAGDPNVRLTLVPNPLESDQILQLALEMPEVGTVTAAIFDYQGKLRMTKNHTFTDEKGNLELNIQSLPSGVYIVSARGKNWILSETLIVE